MEFKTKSGKKVKLKGVSIDDKDLLLDSVEYQIDENGNVGSINMVNTTITKLLRIGLDGDFSDKFLKTLTFEDRTKIFTEMQKVISEGELKPSK